jgi:hypothetical protein
MKGFIRLKNRTIHFKDTSIANFGAITNFLDEIGESYIIEYF